MFTDDLRDLILTRYGLVFPLDLQNQKSLQILYEFLGDSRNASLGDSLVNFVFSCCKSLSLKSLTSLKVPDSIMISAYKGSKLSEVLSLRGEKKRVGNSLEALFLLVWAFNLLSLDDIIRGLGEGITSVGDRYKVQHGRQSEINAFTRIFDIFASVIFN